MTSLTSRFKSFNNSYRLSSKRITDRLRNTQSHNNLYTLADNLPASFTTNSQRGSQTDRQTHKQTNRNALDHKRMIVPTREYPYGA